MLSNLVWGLPAVLCIIAVGCLLTFRTRFIQFREFGSAIKMIYHNDTAGDASGEVMSPRQAVCTALASCVGVGNIVGVAGAIAIGGPGAVFWMWISACLGMCTKFSEVVLAVRFRETDSKGGYTGGPMYTIKNGLPAKYGWLAYLYSVFGMISAFGTGNAIQSNTIACAADEVIINYKLLDESYLGIFNLFIGILMAVLVAVVILGGVACIGRFAEKLVPFMAGLYIIMGVGVIVMNAGNIPHIFGMIFKGAFTPRGVTGGAVGSMYAAFRMGFARGIFSNEAGLGSGSIAHACSSVKDAYTQGLFGIIEVFVDTLVLCTITAMIVLCNSPVIEYGRAAGADLSARCLVASYGSWASVVLAVVLTLFAFSSTIGWGLYGTRFISFVFGSRMIVPYLVVFCLLTVMGAVADLGFIWDVSDIANGLMMIPNLIALLMLSKSVAGIALGKGGKS